MQVQDPFKQRSKQAISQEAAKLRTEARGTPPGVVADRSMTPQPARIEGRPSMGSGNRNFDIFLVVMLVLLGATWRIFSLS
jgi:hypothetical protein